MANEVLAQPALWGAVVGGLLVAVFNQGVTLWKERRQRDDEHQRERTRTALTVAIALESYALACSNCIDDIDRAENEALAQHSESRLHHLRLPELVMPDAPDWRWISAPLADAILGLQLKIQYSRSYIAAKAEFDTTAFDTVGTIEAHARRRGARAWELATELRSECGLPATDVAGEEWDFTQHLFPKPKTN